MDTVADIRQLAVKMVQLMALYGTSRKALSCFVDGSEETAEKAAVQGSLKSGGARAVYRVEKISGQRGGRRTSCQQGNTKAKTVTQGLLGSVEVL